jgi:hypothetical protein
MAANLSDRGIGVGRVLLVCGVSPLLDVGESEAGELSGGLLTTVVVIVISGAIVAVSVAVYRRFRPGDIFGIFLGHHKAGAGSLAHLWKMQIVSKTRCRTFWIPTSSRTWISFKPNRQAFGYVLWQFAFHLVVNANAMEVKSCMKQADVSAAL